jgi:hypothetical protein
MMEMVFVCKLRFQVAQLHESGPAPWQYERSRLSSVDVSQRIGSGTPGATASQKGVVRYPVRLLKNLFGL